MNYHLGICIVCPLNSKIKNYAGCVIIEKQDNLSIENDSEIITFQIRTLAKERFIRKIGEISREELNKIKKGLNEILTY